MSTTEHYYHILSHGKRLKKGVKSFLLFFVAAILSIFIYTLNRGLHSDMIMGYIIVSSLCFTALYLYFFKFRSAMLQLPFRMLFLLSMVLLFLLITALFQKSSNDRVIYMIPYMIILITVRLFFDGRTAMFTLLVELMLVGVIVQSFIFIFTNIIVGMMTLVALDVINRKTRILFAAIISAVCYCLTYSGISLVIDYEDLFIAEFSLFWINGLLILLCYPLISIFEKYFLMISDTSLVILSDKTQPLLHKLSVEAPGTFQHSMQVANLAEEVARKIGANAMLVRTGALYHDIGKLANPSYYTENQFDGVSPHASLEPLQSAQIILDHVKKGIVLAKNYRLPLEVIDFIKTHHGTGITFFFYKKHIDAHPDQIESAKRLFSYSGPKPFSRETAIVMMSDAIEAASRSLKNYSEETINNLVEKIIQTQIQDEQYINVPLTYKEMSDIKEVFKKMLINIYHARIAYPER